MDVASLTEGVLGGRNCCVGVDKFSPEPVKAICNVELLVPQTDVVVKAAFMNATDGCVNLGGIAPRGWSRGQCSSVERQIGGVSCCQTSGRGRRRGGSCFASFGRDRGLGGGGGW